MLGKDKPLFFADSEGDLIPTAEMVASDLSDAVAGLAELLAASDSSDIRSRLQTLHLLSVGLGIAADRVCQPWLQSLNCGRLLWESALALPSASCFEICLG